MVEIVRPAKVTDPATLGYDLVFPIGPGDPEVWIEQIDTIFLNGVPRALRNGARVYLMQGRRIFFSAPVNDILTDSDRVSWITGETHREGPSMLVDLNRGKRHRIDATTLPTPDGKSWHSRRGIKYVTPGCKSFVKVGPKPPVGAQRARSSSELALENALSRKNVVIDRQARRLRILDGAPRSTVEVDIFVPSRKLVIEYDGGYWHRDHQQRDAAKTARLRAAGLNVIRVREGLPALDPTWDVEVHSDWTPDDMARAVLTVSRRHRLSLTSRR